MQRARRRSREDADAAAAMQALPPVAFRREWLRARATAGMVIALARHARAARDLGLLDDAEELAAMLDDPYDGPHARHAVWRARGVMLHASGRLADALVALDRAEVELGASPPVFAMPFHADLAMDRAGVLLDLGDAIAARASAWRAAEWYQRTGDREGLTRVARIVT